MPQVAAVQLNSQNDIELNLLSVEEQLKTLKQQGVELAVLPENCLCFSAGTQWQTAQRFDQLKQQLEQLASKYHMWLIAGTLPCPYRPNGQLVTDNKVRATCLCISPAGQVVARYDKMHLFDALVGDQVGQYQESATFESGEEIVVADTDLGKIGMMVCYDLRFPELSIRLRQQGAQILTAPAAFTAYTGEMHWQLLLRSRAIDTQCFSIGAAQTGTHGARTTWGHSQICDPRGKILSELQQQVSACTADLDFSQLQQVRQSMPIMAHRRISRI